jgi:hypothetical protein
MTLTPHQAAILFIVGGAYLIILGFTSKTLISESDIPATEEERAGAKATPTGRVVCVVLGLVGIIYGIFRILH